MGETVTPVVSVLQAATSAGTGPGPGGHLITADSLSPDTKQILEEISRYLIITQASPLLTAQ